MKVLIVENERTEAEMLYHFLSINEHTIQCAGTFEEAIAYTSSFSPEILICDLNLGEENTGLDVCSAVHLHNPDVKIIVVSGMPLEHLRSAAKLPIIYAILPKPLDLVFLGSLLQNLKCLISYPE